MNVLMQIKDSSADREIKEFTVGNNDEVFIAHSTEESIDLLGHNEIHKAVVNLKSMRIPKYLNTLTNIIRVSR